MLCLHECCMRWYFNIFFNTSSCSFSLMHASHLAMVLFGKWWAKMSLYIPSAHWTLKSLYVRTLLHLFSLLYTDGFFFLYELFYIWGPILLFREFMALFPSFLSFCLSLLRFSMRETWQEIGKSLFEFKFFHLRSLWPGSLIVFLRCSLHTYTSCLKVGRILGNHVCGCAIETVGAVQMQMKYMIQHISVLLPRPLLPTRNKCFASVVSGWDFTCISHLFHLPLPGDRYTVFNFPSQLAKDLPHYF